VGTLGVYDESRRAAADIMGGMDVRRLAAIDMYGTRGTTRRRRIILAEFVLGALVALALGIWLVTVASTLGGRIFGIWVVGVGLNYVPLAIHAIDLTRPGKLDAELAGVDTNRELRRYSVWQFWIFLPLSLIVFQLRDSLGRS
jgi:hypothetical protein